jgi:RNA polymerase sigma-70 factor (ECF subfamily)
MTGPSPQPPGDVRALAQWLAAARHGSKEALGHLLDAYRQRLLQLADHELDPDLRAKGGASDLVQQSFLEAQQAFDRFHGMTGDEFLAWLSRILLNNVANFTRQYRGQTREVAREVPLVGPLGLAAGRELAADVPSPSGEAMAREQAEAVERAFRHLPDDYREVIEFRQRDKLPFEEIGRRLNRSAEAARKLWARAVERLQKEIGGPEARP